MEKTQGEETDYCTALFLANVINRSGGYGEDSGVGREVMNKKMRGTKS